MNHRTMNPRVLPMTVSVFEPNHRMVWTGGGMPEAVFKGERIFTFSHARPTWSRSRTSR
jgi:hypothetical protein